MIKVDSIIKKAEKGLNVIIGDRVNDLGSTNT
jgi:hypothetical protein